MDKKLEERALGSRALGQQGIVSRKKVSFSKVILILTFVFILVFGMAGCEAEKGWTKDGKMIKYEDMSDLSGFYVMNVKDKDGKVTYSPLFNAFSETDLATLSEKGDGEDNIYSGGKDKYIWFSNTKELQKEKFIPLVTRKNPIIYTSLSSAPEEVYIESFTKKGWTVGTSFKVLEDGKTVLMIPPLSLDSSMIAQSLDGDTQDEYEIVKINESKALPISSINNHLLKLTGLEKLKYYRFTFLKGTKVLSVDSLADTEIFVSNQDRTPLYLPFTKTKKGYFVLNLPENASEGYYNLEGVGMFYFRNE
jgi:hypothetical protein